MQVRKRNGSLEDVNLDKITNSVRRCCDGLEGVDFEKIAYRTVGGLYDGVSTKELDELSIQTSVGFIAEDPVYSKVAARLLANYVAKEVETQEIYSFSQSIQAGYDHGLIGQDTYDFVMNNKRKLNALIEDTRNKLFEFYGLRIVYDRYLLKHPITRKVIETPQYFLMRVACGLVENVKEANEFYSMLSELYCMASTPTLFNSGTAHSQMSSCYLLDSPIDSIEDIEKRKSDIAHLSKWAGGIGLNYSRVRGAGALIKGTNGISNGIVPFLHSLSANVASWNQCFHPDTLVYTAKGIKPISEIKADNDAVLGVSGTYRHVEEVMKYPQNGAPMVAIKLRHSMDSFKVTSQHPVWAIPAHGNVNGRGWVNSALRRGKVRPDWIESGQLKVGDYVGIPIPKEIIDVEEFTEDDAYFYGLMLGDGHWCKNRNEAGVTLGYAKGTAAEFVRSYLKLRGIHYWERDADRDKQCLSIRWTPRGRFPFGRDDLYGEDGQKRLHLRLSHLPKSKAIKIIKGLIDTDGHVQSRNTNEVYFYNGSRELIENFRYQCLRFGALCGGQIRERNSVIESLLPSCDVRVPLFEELALQLGLRPLTVHHYFRYQDMVFSRVKSIEPIEPSMYVYDLKVEGDESYSVVNALVHNGGKRKGACCVYLEPHHPDLMEFLELRDNTGDHEKRAYNLNLANWIPDLFMKRVYNDEIWSFFDPTVAPELSDVFGEEYERRYLELEEQGLYKKQLPARVIYHRMMKTIAETGNGWINFKDTANQRGNSAIDGNVIHSSNLCTEILEPTSSGRYEEYPIEQLHELHYRASRDEINCNIVGVDWEKGVVKTLVDSETAVCNLQSINLARHVNGGKMDWDRLAKTTRTAVKYLDRVIDRNFYPTHEARASNMRWRPVGLGLMGWQDVLFQLRIPFESPEAVELSRRISEEVYYHALKASCDLAKLHGPHRDFEKTHAAQGRLQMDLAGHPDAVADPERWDKLRAEIRRSGLRNSLLIAIAPTVTISAISGCFECIEPQISNLFKRETLTGEFVAINKYLVEDLKELGLWDERMRNLIKDNDGSVQAIEEIPEDLRQLYKTAWEVKQKSIIDQMRERGWFIDQSASMNLFVENPTIEKLSSMYMYCWNGGNASRPDGVKTCYYLRSKSATKINRTTGLKASTSEPMSAENTVVEQPDLENPSICEACT